MIYFALLKRTTTGDVDFKDTVCNLKCLCCSSTWVSPILYAHGHSQRAPFYGDQLFMETSWKSEGARASEAHYA